MAVGAQSAASAWAEKRRAQVDAALAKKAQKDMGEVTADHTFKPKLRSKAPATRSGKLSLAVEKTLSLTTSVLKRRPGDKPVELPGPLRRPEVREKPGPARAPKASPRAGKPQAEKKLEANEPRSPPESATAGLFCWKDMTSGLHRWRGLSASDLPGEEALEEPLESLELPQESCHIQVSSPELAQLERMRNELEEEERQMEQEVLRLQAGGADARRLQGLAEEQQQRLARFDREHGHLERNELLEAASDLVPLPVITEQPELLEQLQSQHLEEFEQLQRQWQQEQEALQQKLHDQLLSPEPALIFKEEPEVEARRTTLRESVKVLESQRDAWAVIELEEEQLLERIQQFKVRCEALDDWPGSKELISVPECSGSSEAPAPRRWPPGPVKPEVA